MKVRPSGIRVFAFIALLSLILAVHLSAQTSSGTLRGKVTDPSGAVIAGANITATTPSGQQTSAVSNNQGIYEIKGLAAGTYTVSAVAAGFATDVEPNVAIAAGQVQQFDLALGIAVKQEKVEVEAEGATVSVNPDNNASATIIKGKDLEALSDDPDELQSELEALAGPSAGPNGGQIYIYGFTGGQLRFARFASTRTHFPRNTTNSDTDELKFSPNPAPTSTTVRFSSTTMTRFSTRRIPLPSRSPVINRKS
jgi:hypothetical protein